MLLFIFDSIKETYWFLMGYTMFEGFIFQMSLTVSSIYFGVYHWFSYGLFESFVPIILIFLTTAFSGFV